MAHLLFMIVVFRGRSTLGVLIVTSFSSSLQKPDPIAVKVGYGKKKYGGRAVQEVNVR